MVLGLVMAANPYDSAFATLGRIFGGGARKRMPILTVETNGDARIDLWCRTVPARVEIADMAVKIEAAPLPGDLPAMQGAGQCTPERIKADEEMLASIVQGERVAPGRRCNPADGAGNDEIPPGDQLGPARSMPKNSRPIPELPIAPPSEPGLGCRSSPRPWRSICIDCHSRICIGER